MGRGEECAGRDQGELETVNQANALWTRSKNDITDEQYKEFYKHVGHDFEDPLAWVHARVEGRSEYIQLLYIPQRAPYSTCGNAMPNTV